MEDLLKALRNIGLSLPDHEQLLQLSDPDPEVQDNLARHLSLNPAKDEVELEEGQQNDGQSVDEVGIDQRIDADLFKGAVQALLENYNKFIDKERDALRQEKELLSTPKKVKPVPLKALLARQSAEIKKRQEEYYAAGHDPETGKNRKRFYLPRQTFDGCGSYASSKPLSELKRLTFDELQAPKRFEGRYLLVKVVSNLSLYVSCTFIGLLPSGQAIPISLAHFTSNLHLSANQLDASLPIGTILAIREPFISLNHFGKGGQAQGGKNVVGVRVDTPTDLHIVDGLSQGDGNLLEGVTWSIDVQEDVREYFSDVVSLLRDSPSETNSKGCRWLQDGPLTRLSVQRLKEDRQIPELAELSTDERFQLRLRTRKLIQAFLSDGRPGAALREYQAAMLCGVFGTDADLLGEDLELEGQILYKMCRFEQSRNALETALKTYSSPKLENVQERLLDTLNTVRAAQKASAEGPSHENVWFYYFDSQSYATPKFDIQDWFGPLAVQDIPGAGRGLVTTRDVDEGELLLCCKAAASSYAADPGCRGIHLLRYTVETGVTSTTTQVLAATKAIHAMIDRPQDMTLLIMGLTAGPDVEYSHWVAQPYPAPPKRSYNDSSVSGNEGEALVRAAQVQLDINSDDERAQIWRAALLEGADLPSIDSSYVDGVLRFNAFGPAANPGGKSLQQESSDPSGAASYTDSELSRSTMVHPLPAILNHACLPNVLSVFFGDIVTTRALHPLKKGAEIVHQYVRGDQPWLIRRSQLSKHGFKCGCGICQLDEKDGEEKIRQRNQMIGGSLSVLQERGRLLLKNTDGDADQHKDLAESLLELIGKVQQTYDVERPKTLRPDLMKIYQALALHQSKYDLSSAVQSELKALESIGCRLASEPSSARILADLPSLHFDGGITSMLNVARFNLALGLAEENGEGEAKRWIEQAFYTHQCTIGGGLDIFLDRWQEAFQDLPFRRWLPRC